MVDDFMTFFLAGQETTANTLAFCFLELGKNKDIVNK
jgi:cholesterol 24(S)-hydroxylase